MEEEQRECHKSLSKRQNEILSKLETIRLDPQTSTTYQKWIQQIKQFIIEGGIYV